MKTFWGDERGAAAAEYCLILAILGAAVGAASFAVGSDITAGFERAGALIAMADPVSEPGGDPDPGSGGSPTGPGNSANAPGQSGAAPGQSGSTPGQSGQAPGQGGGGPPGQSGTAPGQSGSTPGGGGSGPKTK